MSGHISEAIRSHPEPNRGVDLRTTPAPSRHLTLVADRDWHPDPIPSLAPVGPSTDF
ncbi:hypothetical protein [Hyphomicrobium sp. 99]|uniref:hypothetical protein n=1 Tax=Hyphomicrobium sp. 99 TaxID=1163419 RepID=UPI001AEBB0EC|nr:hypothetical protein [Hyphomicrobium sp. 99]